jgi:lambda family phage tail tape measure protein
MSDVIAKGVIEVSADSRKLTAGIDEAKRSLKGLGIAAESATKGQSASIDRYVKSLGVAAVTTGKTARELELYKLALRGANAEQLKAADSALRMSESYARGERIGQQIRTGLKTLGVVAATSLIAAYAAMDQLIKKAGDFQDMAEKTGDTAVNIASLAVAAGTAGTEMNTVVGAAQKLTKALTGVDDESKAAGAALTSLGLNISDFKDLKPADQMEAVGKALIGFKDGAEKTAVAMALFGKTGADLLPFLKELGAEGGRQVILTEEQIKLADEYADKQARLKTEISLHAQAIATQMLPALNQLTGMIAELAKDQQFAATAAGIMNGALSAGITVFQTIAVVASDVGFVLKGVGTEIYGISRQIAALASGDLRGFTAISDAMKEDAKRARSELDRFQASVMGIGKPEAKPDPSNYSNEGRNSPLPTLKFEGAAKKGSKAKAKTNTDAEQLAKTQLGYDIASIKSASEALVNTYANAEKMIDALRGAGLLAEKDYYANKRDLLSLNSAAQEKALTDELDRLNKENLAGKAKIENDKKIEEVSAKLAKSRENAWASTAILTLQEVAANKKIEQSYIDAQAAAQSYIDTVMKQNAREIDGIGKGTKYREQQAGLSSIEDKQTTARQGLEGDLRRGQITKEQYTAYLAVVEDTYAKEVDLYRTRTTEIDRMQGDWLNGANEAMANYIDAARDISSQTEQAFDNAFGGMEDALVEFITTGKLSFTSLANSIVADITRIIVKQQIASAAAAVMGGTGNGGWLSDLAGTAMSFVGGGDFASGMTDPFAKIISGGSMRANGGPVSAGEMYQVNERGPELLNVAGKQYLMMGAQGGSVTPNDQIGPSGGNTVNVTVNQTFAPGTTRATTLQAAADASRQLSYAGRNL